MAGDDHLRTGDPASRPVVGETAAPVAGAREQLALLVESVREYAVYLLDPSGLVVTWNPGAQRIKGYRADEIVGQPFARFFPDEDRARGKPAQLLERAQRDGEVRDEGWRVRRDGSRFWVSAVITAVRDERGRLRGFAKVSRDETERHEAELRLHEALARANAAEEQLRAHAATLEATVAERTRELRAQAERLTEANRELEQFNHVASHDLQEPIRMVGMYMQMLARTAAGRLSEHESLCVRYATEGAERMRRLVDDLLRFSRIGRDDQPVTAADSGSALRDALANLADAVARSGAEVIVPTRMPTVRMPVGDLTQLFQNLIGNAIKYAPKASACVRIAVVPDGTVWRFEIADNGIGIDPEFFERIFQPFQRLHTREEYPGNGMGLAICKKLVERVGGRIWVRSTPTAGSTFLFTVPRA